MSLILVVFVIAMMAASAALALQGVLELRSRQLARARALGAQLGKGSTLETMRELRRIQAEQLEKKLPESLRSFLQAKIDKADLPIRAGQLAFEMLAYALLGLLLGLILEIGSYAVLAMLLGLALPFMRVNDLGMRRQLALRKDLPDALDLLTSCVEAGLGFDQALARVAGRIKPGPLKKELEACVAALSVGASRREALRELDRRADLDELSQVVSSLLQADKRGVPLGPALRAQSGQLRVLRSLRVKKAAAEAPLKMLFPLMAFILPVVFIVLFGPIILRWQAGGF